jgi:steroid delta-isomerase-like uncharacterized protein
MTADAPTTTTVESLIRAILDRANHHDAAGMRAYLTDEMIFVNPVTRTKDAREMVDFHAACYAAFPDMRYDIHRVVCGDDVGAAECHITATHQADFMGIAATARAVDFPAVFVCEVSGGKVSHWRAYFDTGTMMRQLGVSA